MNCLSKKYELRVPVSAYIQVIGLTIILALFLFVQYNANHLSLALTIVSRVFTVFACLVILIQIINIVRSTKEIELTANSIKLKNVELQKQDIDKIIIQGYFAQNVGIKQKGKRLVSPKFFFRFRSNEEQHINELKQWAESHEIQVVSGRIYRWI